MAVGGVRQFHRTGVHGPVVAELLEWFEDIADGLTSFAVLVPADEGWGRSALLAELRREITAREAVPAAVVTIEGANLGADAAIQAAEIGALFGSAHLTSRAAEILGVSSLSGMIDRAIAVAGVAVTVNPLLGLALAVGLGAAGKLREGTKAGVLDKVHRSAESVSRVSRDVPVVVLIDDLDRLDLDVATTLIETLIDRYDGHVLITATAPPNSPIIKHLLRTERYGPAKERVLAATFDPGQHRSARFDLARELLPDQPVEVAEHFARRTDTYGALFDVLATDAAADLAHTFDPVALLDRIIDHAAPAAAPTPAEIVIAWAGGALHQQQLAALLAVLGRDEPSGHLVWLGPIVRLADPHRRQTLLEATALWSFATRLELADSAAATAGEIADSDTDPLSRVVAIRAAHQLAANGQPLPVRLFHRLVNDLEALGDLDAALQAALTAAAAHPTDDRVLANVLRLQTRTAAQTQSQNDPAAEWIDRARHAGAITGTEARVWATISLLRHPEHRPEAVAPLQRVIDELDDPPGRSITAAETTWRLALAFHVAQAGNTDALQTLLAPLLQLAADDERHTAAQQLLYALGGPGADHRLAILTIEAELAQLAPDAPLEQRLRIVSALAHHYGEIGRYREALQHTTTELDLRTQHSGPDHPNTLAARSEIAHWAGRSGDARRALTLFEALLPDRERVLSPDHPDTLSTRSNIAALTGECGHARRALTLFETLLPDQERVLSPDHPDTLRTRGNIAHWAEQRGDAQRALTLSEALLPDRDRVLGPDHPDTLTTRSNIAAWAGQRGDAQRALTLFEALLPDRERVLGPDHPDTLRTRNNIAVFTSQNGDDQRALTLYKALLPDLERVLGPDHPGTLTSRGSIAALTGRSGDAQQTLTLYKALLPDQERVLGPDHPATRATRGNIAYWEKVVEDQVE